jgi:hypothetical protein
MTFIAGFALGMLTIIGVSLIAARDLDNNDD